VAPPANSARDDLLARLLDHVAAHGLSDLSLRELAAAVGSSHRMLIYHFDSREGLVAAIVAEVEARQRLALELLADDAAGPTELVRAQWAQLTDPELTPLVKLFFEVLAMALHGRPGTEGFLAALTDPWLDTAAAVAERLDLATDRDQLRLGVAVVRGLLIEVVATGDPAPATASLEVFLAQWQAHR
jgi:AcrR family transcriptional regulator